MDSHHGPRLLVIEADPSRARALCEKLQARGLEPACVRPEQLGAQFPDAFDAAAVVLPDDRPPDDEPYLREVLEKLRNSGAATLLWAPPSATPAAATGVFEQVPPEISLDEVVGRLTILARYAPVIRRLDQELSHVQRLGRQLNRYFAQIDQEMRLAGRLQRDLLPRKLPEVPGVRMAALYRPAAWVSGDIYDVIRIDAERIGLFVADAMGHGTSAGLMTMFLRNALLLPAAEHPQRARDPAETLLRIHEGLVKQNLPSSHFVTAVYGVLDVTTLRLRLARGGHPFPLHVRPDGQVDVLRCEGGLLGVPMLEPEFEVVEHQLWPGSRLLLYSDGLEDALIASDGSTDKTARLIEMIRPVVADADPRTAVRRLEALLDQREGSLNPADDVTVLVVEIAADK